MTELEIYQSYWWLLICVLGAALVFMLFVLGGQSMLLDRHSEQERQLMVNSLGRKWELTFTTLVVFGGAFFASFPLFYSTSFGGAYWLWTAILLCFVAQAVCYEFRRKRGNLYGTKTYDMLLFLGGLIGCVMLGAAVAMLYFGGDFQVTRSNLVMGGNPVISQWAPTHGLEIMASGKCLLLGFTVFFLARLLAALYFINNIRHSERFEAGMRKSALWNGLVFAVLFVIFVIVLLTSSGLKADADGDVQQYHYLYLHNLLDMWWWGALFLIGTVMTLYGLGTTAFTSTRNGIWHSGIGVVLVIISLLAVAGYDGTCYLPSVSYPQSSLTLANSSSSLFTLKVMSIVSLFVPFVLAYIWVVWRKMNAKPLSDADISSGSHQY